MALDWSLPGKMQWVLKGSFGLDPPNVWRPLHKHRVNVFLEKPQCRPVLGWMLTSMQSSAVKQKNKKTACSFRSFFSFSLSVRTFAQPVLQLWEMSHVWSSTESKWFSSQPVWSGRGACGFQTQRTFWLTSFHFAVCLSRQFCVLGFSVHAFVSQVLQTTDWRTGGSQQQAVWQWWAQGKVSPCEHTNEIYELGYL